MVILLFKKQSIEILYRQVEVISPKSLGQTHKRSLIIPKVLRTLGKKIKLLLDGRKFSTTIYGKNTKLLIYSKFSINPYLIYINYQYFQQKKNYKNFKSIANKHGYNLNIINNLLSFILILLN